MGTSLLHRFFGVGKIPQKYAHTLASEGIVLKDEGVKGIVTLKNYRSPGRYHRFKKTGFVGAIVLTQQRFLVFTYSRPVVNVPLKDPRFGQLELDSSGDYSLSIHFDVSVFSENNGGEIFIRLDTTWARLFIQHLQPFLNGTSNNNISG